MYMDEIDPESGDAMDALLSNAAQMLGTRPVTHLFGFGLCVTFRGCVTGSDLYRSRTQLRHYSLPLLTAFSLCGK
jgi:hypothetical protein